MRPGPGSNVILSCADTGARPSTRSGVRPYVAGPSRQIASNTNTRWEYPRISGDAGLCGYAKAASKPCLAMVVRQRMKGRAVVPAPASRGKGTWLVGLDGLEPSTSVLSGPRSNRLSYRPGDEGCALRCSLRAKAAGYTAPILYPPAAGRTSSADSPSSAHQGHLPLQQRRCSACQPAGGGARTPAPFRADGRRTPGMRRWGTATSAPGS